MGINFSSFHSSTTYHLQVWDELSGKCLKHYGMYSSPSICNLFPEDEMDWRLVTTNYKEAWDFDHCVGAVADKHVVTKVPDYQI